MSIFKLNLKPLPHSLDSKFKWCIDSPSMGQDFVSKDLANTGLQITGWLIQGTHDKGKMVVLQKDEVHILGGGWEIWVPGRGWGAPVATRGQKPATRPGAGKGKGDHQRWKPAVGPVLGARVK